MPTEYHHCRQRTIFPSKKLLVLPVLGWTEKRIIHSSALLSPCVLENCRAEQALLPQFIKCSPCESSRMERTKERKHQTEILNILHWPALHSLLRFYLRTRTNAGKRGKNLPAILLSHCLLQLVWNHRVTLFLAGQLQRQHLELSFHFNYLLKPLIGRRE